MYNKLINPMIYNAIVVTCVYYMCSLGAWTNNYSNDKAISPSSLSMYIRGNWTNLIEPELALSDI